VTLTMMHRMMRVWKSRAVRWATCVLVLPIGIGAVGAAIFVFVFPYPKSRLTPDVHTSLVLTDRNGEVLRTLPLATGGRAQWLPIDRVPVELVDATLASEDGRFFTHHGVDATSVVRAGLLALRHGRIVSGASTITMQLARLVEPHRKNLPGKIWEMLQAFRLERAVSKREILEQYFNRAYYGNGAFGVEAASRRYFDKPASLLGPGEAILLAVLPRAPRRYDPLVHLDDVLARRERVMELMVERNLLTEDKRGRIAKEPIRFTSRPSPRFAAHFVNLVLSRLGPRKHGGIVPTTLDAGLQRRLATAVAQHVAERAPNGPTQAGVVVIDPRNGAVLAMVGSADYDDPEGGQNNILTRPRHPGSALKPFVYAMAIENGGTPSTRVEDSLDAIPNYHPRKQMRAHGRARFREALAGSFNLAAVEVLDGVGVASLLDRLRSLGLSPLSGTSNDYGLDLALGSARVRMLDLAAAYAFLVSGGDVHVPAVLLDEPPKRAGGGFTAEASWLVMDMLSDPDARRSVFGDNLPFDLPFKVAAKTGTSSGFADTVAVIATSEAVVAAWAGCFDGSGSKGALAMWSAAPLARASLLAVADIVGRPLTLPAAPAGITTHDVCRISGLLPGPHCPHKREHFIASHQPGERCDGRHDPGSP